MKIGDIKTKATQIIREYSNNGSLIGSGENADYLLSMNSFINDAQFEIANKHPIIKKLILGEPDEVTELNNKYNMPSNFKGLKNIKVSDYPFEDYEFEEDTLVIPKCYDGTFNLWYFANPTEITNSTTDNIDLEVSLDLQMTIPYYVAGHVIIDENPSLAQFFLDEYSTKLRKIKSKNSQKRIKYKCGW